MGPYFFMEMFSVMLATHFIHIKRSRDIKLILVHQCRTVQTVCDVILQI